MTLWVSEDAGVLWLRRLVISPVWFLPPIFPAFITILFSSRYYRLVSSSRCGLDGIIGGLVEFNERGLNSEVVIFVMGLLVVLGGKSVVVLPESSSLIEIIWSN